MPLLIETERLRIRPWTFDDVAAVLEIYGDPDVGRHLGGFREPDADLAAARARLERWQERFTPIAPLGLLAVEPTSGGTPIGGIGLVPLSDSDDIEIAYHFAKRAWGQGFATEATRAVVSWGFESLGLDRVLGLVHPDNRASARVLEKVGFQPLGKRQLEGETFDQYVRTP
ncbi:MAG: GNAT family N-acetyltransferase [Planctomycetota bacterium]